MKRLQGKYRPEANVSISEVMGKPEASTDIHRAEVNGLYITDNGELYRRLPDLEDETQGVPLTSYVNAQGNEVALKGNQIKILKDAVALARTARELINLQVTDITDPELEPLRTRLNQQYDQFVKKYKMINRPYNKGLLFRTDITISPLLMALENHYQKEVKQNKKLVRTESSTKADIFTQRTQEPYREVSKVNDADQALLVALSQTGRVDLTRMADLSGISQEQLIDDLKGQIFNDPVAGWVTRDEYLSGNVKLKLRQAEEAGLMDYAKALQEAIPADVPATDIVTVMGAHWQTPEVINEFWKHLGGTEPQAYFVPERNLWEFKGQASDSKKWRTAEKGMLYLFDKVLNNKAISVTYKDAITGKSRLDVRATDAAMAKADEIRNEFNAWLWRDEQRREAMVRRYNDLVNTHKNRQYDGSFLSFPGMTKDIDLYDTQKNAIWRMLQSKTTLLDHIVGAGKTFTMIAGAMEMRRTGLAKKPMFVVPNHLVGQWAEYFARLYPNARVLAATKDDFNKHKRKEFLARVATGDWDAVIVAHSSFGKMPTDPQTEHWFLKKQIKDAELAIDTLRKQDGKDNRSVGQIAKARDALKEKLKKSLANTDKDQGMTWAETGVDALFVDEAHEFKNLSFLTSMDRVKNINPQGSNKAMDLFIKSQALLRSTGGRNLVFATGTPVSNSMAELFTMQRYLDYTGLTDAGVNHFDAWARTFGRTVTKQERKSSGKYGPESRFAEFINLPELIAKYRNFADTINQEDIDAARAKKGGGKITPKVKGGKPQVKIAPRSMFQEAFMGEIEYRFANMPEDPREDNPLMATNDARKAGLDMRLVYDELPDDPDSKINLSIKEMMRIYHHWADDKGTQLVFCDLSTPKKSQEQEIKAFKEKVKKIAKKDPDSRNVDKMSVTEAYEYLQYMADNEIGNAADLVEKVTIDEIDSWSSKFDVYNDIKQKLIAQGVPEDEIAFIHDANTQAQKDDLFDKVRRGDVRFLLGSTFKMGAGTNVQNRLVGLHHLDAPWRPSDLEQREGRIIRQGNELFKRDPEKFEVEILRYATEQTYDTNMWQMLEVKSLFIQQLRRGNLTDRTAQDVSGQAATAAEMKAASSGDPRIIEQVELNAAISKLDNLRTTHDRNRTQASIDVGKYTKEQNYLPGLIKRLQADQRNTLPIPVKGPALTKPDGTGFKDAKEANKWFKSQILKAAKNPNSPLFDGAEIANYRGFGVYVELGMSGKEPFIKDLMLVGQENHYVLHDLMLDKIGWDGFTVRFNNAINRIERNIEQAQERLESLPSIIAENEEIARTAFPHEEDYQAKVERNRELIEELNTEEVENPEAKWMMEYELFKKMAEDFQSLKEKASGAAKKLEYSAKQNRANRLMEMILYSGPYQQKAQAKKAMALAKEQKIVITQKAIQEAQQRADEALAKHKLSEEQKKQKEQLEPKAGGNSATTTTETTADTVTFTSADDAIAHSRDKKQAITADNGNIRLERTSLGNWQLSVAWQDKKGFDDDSIVMDTDLSLMTGGRGFSNVGDKMVLTFKEDRLPMIVRRLFNKMPLQGVVANKGNTDLSEPILRREVEGKVENPMTVDQVNDTVEDELKNLDIDVSQYVDIKIANTVEELYGPGFEPFTGAITAKSGSERPTIILIASLHKSSAEVRATLQHELIGHFGMARFISPKEKQKLLNKVKISKKALKPAWDYVEKNYGDKSLDEQAEEVVAYIAEHPHRKNSRWESIVNHIVRLMKNVGFFKQQISHDEIVSLLSSIAKVMRANGQGNLFYSIGLDENKQYYGPGIVTREQHITGIPEQLTEPIHYRRDGSAEFTSPNSNDNPTDNANRFFNTLALAENQLIQKALTQAKRKGSSAMAMLRKGLLPAMGLRQIVDTYEHIFDPMTNETYEITGVSKGNPIRHYQSYVQGMQSLKANKLAEADDVDIKWGKLAKNNPQEYNEMADIMHESTVYEVFPDKDYFEEHENMEDLKRLIATEPHEGQREALRKRMMFERERVSKYNELSQRYQAMSQEAKDVYKAVEGYYEQMWNEHQQALIDKITRSMGSNNEAITFIQELKRRFHEAKVKGPYFPLQRFGQYYLIAEDEHGVYYREQYETEAQLYDNKDEIERAGMRVLSYGLMPDFTSRKLEGVSMFADQIHVALEGDKFAHVSEVVKDEIRTEINQLALQMLPDVSAAKSMIRRRKVKGFSQNARRAFAFSAIHQSNRLTRTVYGDRMTEQLERIHDDIDSHNQEPFIPMEDRTVAAQVLSELEKQHEYIMNPKGGPIAARVTNLAFIWYLGASAGAGLINMSQTALIGIPLMGGRFGYRKTTAEITKAAKDFAKYGYNKLSLRESLFTLSKATKGLTNDEKEMIQTLIDDGTIDTTQTSTLSQIADTDLKASAQVGQDRWVKVNRLLGFFFHNAEVANREVTALATYRLARKEGQNHHQAIETARKLTFDSHFDYSGANRPRVMKSDWMKVFTIFKQYSQNMTYTLVRNFATSATLRKLPAGERKRAFKALAGILFAHATVAGTLGLPLISWIGPVLAAALGDDDDEFKDWQTLYRNWLSDLFGKDVGHAIAKGVFNGFMGTDIHARTKIDDLWIQSPNYEMSAREESMHYLLQGLGPAVSAAINFFWLGPEQIAEGNTWKGIEKMVPKFVRDGIRTYRYATEGATVGRDGYQAVIEDFTPWELSKQFMGLSPARLSEGYEARSAVKNLQSKIGSRRSELVQEYTKAYMEGDQETANRILMEIQQFNLNYPTFGITGQSLRSSLKLKYRYKDLSQSGIYLPQAQMGLLNEARFAL